MNKRRKI